MSSRKTEPVLVRLVVEGGIQQDWKLVSLEQRRQGRCPQTTKKCAWFSQKKARFKHSNTRQHSLTNSARPFTSAFDSWNVAASVRNVVNYPSRDGHVIIDVYTSDRHVINTIVSRDQRRSTTWSIRSITWSKTVLYFRFKWPKKSCVTKTELERSGAMTNPEQSDIDIKTRTFGTIKCNRRGWISTNWYGFGDRLSECKHQEKDEIFGGWSGKPASMKASTEVIGTLNWTRTKSQLPITRDHDIPPSTCNLQLPHLFIYVNPWFSN